MLMSPLCINDAGLVPASSEWCWTSDAWQMPGKEKLDFERVDDGG